MAEVVRRMVASQEGTHSVTFRITSRVSLDVKSSRENWPLPIISMSFSLKVQTESTTCGTLCSMAPVLNPGLNKDLQRFHSSPFMVSRLGPPVIGFMKEDTLAVLGMLYLLEI